MQAQKTQTQTQLENLGVKFENNGDWVSANLSKKAISKVEKFLSITNSAVTPAEIIYLTPSLGEGFYNLAIQISRQDYEKFQREINSNFRTVEITVLEDMVILEWVWGS